jgi:uncharacterized protein (DUF433 family)
MPDIDIIAEFMKTLKISGTAEVLHKPGAVKLDGFPLLAYAPAQHGPGVRTEDVGASVADIATEYAVNPSVGAVAAKYGTTEAHVVDALKYAEAVGFAEVVA